MRALPLTLCVSWALGAACQPTTRPPPPPPPPVTLHLAISAVRAADFPEAEDGSGHMVRAVSPVALDAVSPDPWPARALDPSLTVGALRFYRYTYQSEGVLRFIAADRGALQAGAPVSIQYGDDDRSRVTLGVARPQ